jgi:hypothetical protein
VSSTTSDTVLHSCPNNPSAKIVVEISQRETGDQAADITEDLAMDSSLWEETALTEEVGTMPASPSASVSANVANADPARADYIPHQKSRLWDQ